MTGSLINTLRQTADEETLLRRFVENRDEEAFESLIKARLPSIRRIVTAASGNRSFEDREDILQEVLIRLHQNLSGFRFEASFTTYVFRITRNVSLDMLRTYRRSRNRDQRFLTNKVVTDEGAWGFDPEELAVQALRTTELRNMFFRLREQDRQLLLLREKEKLSIAEISKILGIPEGTTKSRLARSRERAKKIYEDANERE